MAQDFYAIDAWHLDVRNDNVVERAVNLVARRVATGDGFHLVAIATQRNIKQFANGALVIADQNVTHVRLRLVWRRLALLLPAVMKATLRSERRFHQAG